MKRLAIYAAGMLVCGALRAQTAVAPSQADMRRLSEQAVEWLWAGNSPEKLNPSSGGGETGDNARVWASELQGDGSWRDIDYKDETRGFWKTTEHLKRTLAMAEEATKPGGPGGGREEGQAAMRSAALRAARYWVSHDFKNPNWWQNQIGVPQEMVEILLLLGDDMTAPEKAAALKIVDRATFSMTGQNRVWMAGIIFRKALVEGNGALALEARNTILAEVKISTEEGMQPDWSFHQHGPEQQMGNYGLAFAEEMASWARIWRGTAVAAPEDKLALLRNLLVKGEAAMLVNGTMDISGCDRQLFPESPDHKGAMIRELLTGMAATDASHAQEYSAAERAGTETAGAGAAANWNFYRSETMVHRRPGFYASVKLSSARVIGEEMVNGENLRGRYLADGATFLYQTGKEYADIFPVWDWRRVPGVTCAVSGTTLAPAGKMATDFAGGASDGSYGVEGLDYRRDGVTARKGWFFLDQGVVCLGAGITGSGVRTSIDQCLSDGPAETASGPISGGVNLYPGVSWVRQGGEGYLFFPGEREGVWAGAQPQTGSWRDVYGAGSAAPVTKAVFSLWIEHPDAGGSYAYMLVPGATSSTLNACVEHPPALIRSNTPDVQAVWDHDADVYEALFYKAATLTTKEMSITTSGPCAIIIRGGAIIVADPTQKQQSLTLTVHGTTRTILLPSGEWAGSSCRW